MYRYIINNVVHISNEQKAALIRSGLDDLQFIDFFFR